MRFQMSKPKFAFQGGCGLHRLGQFVLLYLPALEKSVQRGLGFDPLLANSASFGSMTVHELLRRRALLGSQVKPVGKLKDMRGAGKMVELGGFRVAHTCASQILLHFILGQRFDIALLLARIRLGLVRGFGSSSRNRETGEKYKASYLMH
jgi:hypothetical protein